MTTADDREACLRVAEGARHQWRGPTQHAG